MIEIKTINQRREKPQKADNISTLFYFRLCAGSPKGSFYSASGLFFRKEGR